jgi:hypothetical protein
MKKTVCLAGPALLVSLILAVAVWAQNTNACPINLLVQGTEVEATNVSSKPIALVGLRAWYGVQPVTDIGAHDFYFKPLQPGETHQLVPPNNTDSPPPTQQEIVVVQFADGTTWGDATLLTTQLAEMIAWRPKMRKMYQAAVAAYDSGGDSGLLTFFQNTIANHQDVVGIAHKYLKIANTSGVNAAISQIRSRLAAAPTSF